MSDERTEPATPKRRKKAREDGQVARSAELVGCVILLGFLWAIPAVAPGMARGVADYASRTIGEAGQVSGSADGLGALGRASLLQMVGIAGPALGLVAVAALASNMLQVGFQFSPKSITPRFDRLNPVQGLQRMVTGRSVMELAKGIVKLVIVGCSGWNYLRGHWEGLFLLTGVAPGAIAPQVGGLAYGMAMQMVATLTVVAAIDYAYQRWQLERSLKMTKQEVKDELRENEGNPEIRAQVRRRQREIARRRMMAAVPTASVVITNPTHYAVALKYEMGGSGAPQVVAKGQDLVAKRIREIARENDVPVMENPPLARAVYAACDLDEEIPAEMYRAVAEVLALVWKLGARRAVV